jgi:uncharacterized delta-60 repeat protein
MNGQARRSLVVASVLLSVFVVVGAAGAGSAQPPGSLAPGFTSFPGRVTTPIGSSADLGTALVVQSDGKAVVAGVSNLGSGESQFGLARYNRDGSLDTSFDGDGIVTTQIDSQGRANALVAQPDGKLVAAGVSWNGSEAEFALARYNPDGSLDTSFDGDGVLTTPIGVANALALQADGRLVAAGRGDDEFVLARYNPDGSLDTSFDNDGIVTTAIGSADSAWALVVQKDGKLVAAGTSFDGSEDDFAVVRYNADGSLDTNFDGDGILTTPIGSPSSAVALALVAQKDGKLVAAGDRWLAGDRSFAVVRYDQDGSLDSSFGGGDGIVTTSISGADTAFALAVQKDGKLVAAGRSYNGTNNDFALARYTKTGALDPSFGGGDGIVTTPVRASGEVRALALQKDGKVVAAGHSWDGVDFDFALARYTKTGALDPSFSSFPGRVTTPVGSSNDAAHALVVQKDGKLVAAGQSFNGSDDDFVLARYGQDGSLDTSFGGDGILTTPIGTGTDVADALVVQKDRKLVAAGNSAGDFALARYRPDGSLDTGFDGDGILTTPIGTGTDIAFALVLQKNGKLVAAGESFNGTNFDFALARYNPDGSLDTSFGGGDGVVTTPIGSGHDVARALVVQTDGKLVAAGYSSNGADNDLALARYDADGSLDTGFGGGDGTVTTPIGPGADIAYALVLQKDGKLVAAGGSSNGADDDLVLVRYDPDGSLDTSFGGGDGIATTPVGSSDDAARALALQKDGELVAAGSSSNGADLDFALVRYTKTGVPDTRFGGDGIVTTAIGPGSEIAEALAVQKDGKLNAAGLSFNGTDYDFALARYLP